jgi:hypothetical protein
MSSPSPAHPYAPEPDPDVIHVSGFPVGDDAALHQVVVSTVGLSGHESFAGQHIDISRAKVPLMLLMLLMSLMMVIG